MKKLIITLSTVILLLFSASVFAQPGFHDNPEHRAKIHERVKTIKMLKLTETLDLTEEQAARFFPRFNEFDKTVEEVHREIRQKLEDLGHSAKLGKDDSELRTLMQEYDVLSDRMFEARKQFQQSVTDILSVNQQARLMVFMERFPEMMRDVIHEMRPPGKRGHHPPKDHPRDRGPGPR